MEKLKEELRQSVSEIRSRYEGECKQFTVDTFDIIENDIDVIDEACVTDTLENMVYVVSTSFEVVDPSLVDSLAFRDLLKLLKNYLKQYS